MLDLITVASEYAQKYITLKGVHPTQKYSYAARGFQNLSVIEHELHAPKCKSGESWLYFALPKGLSLKSIEEGDRLYVGAQTQDRMFRGDGFRGANFHHADMRAGNGSDNPVNFLNSGQQIEIFRINALKIERMVPTNQALSELTPILCQPRTSKKHLGWWFEQYVLYCEPNIWRWNTDPAAKDLAAIYTSEAIST